MRYGAAGLPSGHQRRRMKVTPSRIGTSTDSTRSSAITCSLNAAMPSLPSRPPSVLSARISAAVGELREHGFVVLDVVRLPRVDEDEIPRPVERRDLGLRVADAVLDAVGDAALLGVAARHRGRLLLDVEREERAARRQAARDLDPRPAGEDADLEHAHRLHERDDEAEERALVRADRHLRRLLSSPRSPRRAAGARRAAASCAPPRMPELLRSRMPCQILPMRTQPLCPPRPIAFESATSTCTRRASLGT